MSEPTLLPVIRAGSFLVAPRAEEVDPEEERLHPWQRWLRLAQMLRELAAGGLTGGGGKI